MEKSKKVKNKLQNNELTIGSWLTIPHHSIVEIMASAGFEWIVIDIEHSAIDIQSVQNLIAHIQGNSMDAFVRVSKNEEVIIKRVLDAGADGVIIPMVKSKSDAIKAIEYVKYPPEGKRGVGLSRAQNYGIGFEKYKQWLDKNVIIIIQIEHIDAVNNLEEMLNIKSIDGLIIGPYDLSASMNLAGELEHFKVIEAVKKVEKIAKKLHKPLGFHVIQPEHKDLQKKVSEGYTFLAFSLDFFFMGEKARKEMGKILE